MNIFLVVFLPIIKLTWGQTGTRMPMFCGYPSVPHDYPPCWPVHIRLKVKTRQSQNYKFKEFAKTSNFWILIKKTLHATHLLKLLDKMCKYEMEPASITEDTEQTWFCPQTDRQTEEWTDWQGETSISPLQLHWAGAIKMSLWGSKIFLKKYCRSYCIDKLVSW